MSILDDKISAVRSEDPRGYGKRELPCRLDELMTDLINELVKSDPLERQRALGGVDEMFTRVAQVYAERMAMLAVRRTSAGDLFNGFVALSALQGSEPRETVLVLSLLYDATRRLGRDPRAEIERCRPYATVSAFEQLVRFGTRKPEDQSIEAMRYRATSDESGFRYERTR